ncbi:MAG: hypothetical protein LBC18_16060, partial [Opitutaceae bacterium]|nr:hypothetical protein [Opitutaceae bacterium]
MPFPANIRDAILFPRMMAGLAGPAIFAVFAGLAHGAPAPAKNYTMPKDLPAGWEEDCAARGARTIHRGGDLRMIGMPVGGLCAGQLYLGGDGRLLLWDIFNRVYRPGLNGLTYETPPVPERLVDQAPDQGFALRVKGGGREECRRLDRTGFADIAFSGEYPIGTVGYRDPALPVSVRLEAFSPFVPLDTDNSSLPATLLHYTLTNDGPSPVEAEVMGWMQNVVARTAETLIPVLRTNRVEAAGGSLLLRLGARPWRGGESTTVEHADAAAAVYGPLRTLRDYGEMGLMLLDAGPEDRAVTDLPDGLELGQMFAALRTGGDGRARAAARETGRPMLEFHRAAASRTVSLSPGQSRTISFAVLWHFPNLSFKAWEKDPQTMPQGRHYAARFPTLGELAAHVAGCHAGLSALTRLWRDTWYDSTLPCWFLDRTFMNTSTLATSTVYRYKNGRFWGWEGVGACHGTCNHVWHYAQAMARLFPDLERDVREHTNLGFGLNQKTGAIRHRHAAGVVAVDGMAGIVLGALREHQMSADDAFLRRVWPRLRLVMENLIRRDPEQNGLLAGAQHNTLDSSWHGSIAWLSGMYLAALRASEEMALEAGDRDFARTARAIFERGRETLPRRLWGGEYFINLIDPAKPESVNSGTGCFIDQVLGQGWAFQAGLGRVFPEDKTRRALQSLWRYNFTTDVGSFRAANPAGRPLAMPGEGGMVMCTFPRDDWDYERAKGAGRGAGFARYLNECMTGFEYQVA